MTCIVAITSPEGTYIGSDSRVTGGDKIWYTTTPKIVKFGPLMIGVCGSTQFVTALRLNKPAEWDARASSIDEYLGHIFLPHMRQTLDAVHGWDLNDGIKVGPHLLVASHNGIWEVTPWGGVDGSALPYHAIGSGREIAMGALHMLYSDEFRGIIKSPEQKIRLAIGAACNYCTDCGGVISVYGPIEACQ